MYILAIETTGKYGSAAVADGSGRVWTSESKNERNHLRDVISLCDRAICAAGISKKDITHIAASVGPGSFTGIRIGITTARTLAQMFDIGCIAVSTLEAMAMGVRGAADSEGAGYIAAVINARRHQVYAGIREITGTGLRPFLEERQYMIEELIERLAEKCPSGSAGVFITGDGIDAYEDIIKSTALSFGMSGVILADESIRYQTAADVAAAAVKKAGSGEIIPYDELKPEYMRLSEAEQRLREGTLSDKIRMVR